MSSLGSDSRRTTPLLDLSGVVREEISFSPVPGHQGSRSSRGNSLDSTPAGYSASLIEPVMDDREVLSTSVRSDRSSVILRHKEAAKMSQQTRSRSYGTLPSNAHVQQTTPDFLKKPTPPSIEDEFEKIQARNEAKRQDHATTYAISIDPFPPD